MADKCVAAVEKQLIQNGPIQCYELQKYTDKDPISQKEIRHLHEGWPSKLRDPTIKPFATCRHKLSLNDGCLIKHREGSAMRIVVPAAIRPHQFQQLHRAHVGASRPDETVSQATYLVARHQTAQLARTCEACCLHRNNSPVALAPSTLGVSRSPVDFAGPFKKWMWLIVVDAHSKWPEVMKLRVGSTTDKPSTSVLSKLSARFGLPKQSVSEKGLQKFCEQRGILHTLVPAYHPGCNGQAERFVKTFKKGIRKGMEEEHTDLDVVDTLLAVCRNTAHQTTGESLLHSCWVGAYATLWACCTRLSIKSSSEEQSHRVTTAETETRS